MDAFGVFKIILGIVLSIFILMIVLSFSTSYMDINETKRKATEINSFERGVMDVYVNGIPGNFSFSDDVYPEIIAYRPPQLLTRIINIDFVFVPVFFKEDKVVSISRNSVDLGWWKFNYITILPEMKIIYVPLSSSDVTWETISLLTSKFPDTQNIEPKTTFGFGCEDVSYFHLNKWTRENFIKNVVPYIKTRVDYSKDCGEFTEKGETLVYIGNELSDFNKGFFIVPQGPSEGKIYTNKSGNLKEYVYRDGLDLLAIILGGEDFYDYKSSIYLKQLKTAAKIKHDEALLLSKSVSGECSTLYSNFASSLEPIYKFTKEDYSDETKSRLLSEGIQSSMDANNIMGVSGCV